ncbi:MAG: AMP-binding protein [Cyclobacteriaceae bacterium]|nr:AMP-binding protein [Cyclobacteriaceae bacterium]
MVRVQAGGTWLSQNDILQDSLDRFNSFERHAIGIIRQWYAGQQTFVFKTSGSTGPSKELVFQRRQVESSTQLSINAFQLKPGQKSLICLDTHFVAGTMMILRSLIAGMDIIIEAPSSKPKANQHIDFVALVPLQVATLLNESKDALDAFSTVIIGGGPLAEETVTLLQSSKARCFATYGMTETLTHIALRPLNGIEKTDAFRFLPGITGFPDSRGCLVIHAPHLGNPVVTNDVVEFTATSLFRVIGRIDDVINSGGIKIHPTMLEEKIRPILVSMDIASRNMIGKEQDALLGESVCLILEGTPLTPSTERMLMERMRRELPRFEAPKRICYLSSFPLTETQKVDRKATMMLAIGKK